MSKFRLAAGAALILASSLGINAAEAGCKQGYCMSGYYSGKQRWVDFTSDLVGTHYNVFNGRKQIELGRNQSSFRVFKTDGSSPASYRYSIQTCNRGGAFSRSTCSPWVTFTHTDRE